MFATVTSRGTVLTHGLTRGILKGTRRTTTRRACVDRAKVSDRAGMAEGGLVVAVDIHGALTIGISGKK